MSYTYYTYISFSFCRGDWGWCLPFHLVSEALILPHVWQTFATSFCREQIFLRRVLEHALNGFFSYFFYRKHGGGVDFLWCFLWESHQALQIKTHENPGAWKPPGLGSWSFQLSVVHTEPPTIWPLQSASPTQSCFCSSEWPFPVFACPSPVLL